MLKFVMVAIPGTGGGGAGSSSSSWAYEVVLNAKQQIANKKA